jgi:hypothetical protein
LQTFGSSDDVHGLVIITVIHHPAMGEGYAYIIPYLYHDVPQFVPMPGRIQIFCAHFESLICLLGVLILLEEQVSACGK